MATMPRPPAFGRVAVGADHHPAGERVVLEHDLVDDPAARLPEADAVLGRDRAEEVVDLGVGVLGDLEVLDRPDLGLDQVVAVDGGGHRDLGQAGGHELEQRHLRGGVLHGDAVGVEVGVGAAPLGAGRLGVAEVVEQDLLGEGQRLARPAPARRAPVPGGGRRPAPPARSGFPRSRSRQHLSSGSRNLGGGGLRLPSMIQP